MRRSFLHVTGCFCSLLCVAILTQPALAQRGGAPLAILAPGAGGPVPSDVLMRNEQRLRAAGIETIVVTSAQQAASASASGRQSGKRVFIVGMSRGATIAAQALAFGAAPDGAIFVSGNGLQIIEQLGSAARLPRTLAIHHRRDACRFTAPDRIRTLASWSRGRVQIRWVETTGAEAPNPCGPFGAHGFYRDDEPAVSAMINFIARS